MRFRNLIALAAVVVLFLSFAGTAKAAEFASPVFAVNTSTKAAAPVKMPAVECFNCTVCGDGCTCFGGGYYCKDGRCPVTPGNVSADATTVQYRQVCENGVCRLVPINQPTAAPFGFSGPVFNGSSPVAAGDCATGNCGPSVGSGASGFGAGASSSGGQRSGWWLGKNLGRPAPPRRCCR